MGWVGRLFDARDTLARMLLLDLSGVGYLVVGAHGRPAPTATQWLLAVAAFTVALLCHRRPLLNLLIQSALLVAALPLVDDVTINQVGASWALLELTMRAARPRTFWLAAGLVAAIDLSHVIGDPLRQALTGVFGLAVTVGLPLLLGLVVRTTRELARQAEERAAAEQRRHESESRAARADERAAIARELHDVLAHHVASMVLRVGVARHVLTDLDPRVGEVFGDVHRTGTAALTDLRRLVAVLRDPDGVRGDAALTAIEPAALPAALGAAVDRARQAGVTVEADVDPAVGTLDAVRSQAVLRLTQEALTNVAKHAGAAARARFTVTVVDGAVHWAVSDDGRGAASAVVPAGGGHGIVGMRERVEVLGGRLEAGPTGEGWRVRTVLPPTAPDRTPGAAPRPRPVTPEPA
ncbi:two-component sensor histidine kinase [Micromonospora sp. WMMA1996]|uniref:sensor histidine kinase n=1 Tax=Micromonospora sp. WMMA1996 TaxID=2039878 RepID=UPI000BF5BB0F|nr:histidine kinase [Micromonospora sp. WMMA1996]PGH44724.1 two-component sensor histidine kinase [Micromonospora sp. WMMA1996]